MRPGFKSQRPHFILKNRILVMRKPTWQQDIARERIEILFDLAKKECAKHPERSVNYVNLGRKIGLRYNVRLSREMKKSFCKRCSAILIPGRTLKTRIDSKTKTIVNECTKCGKIFRYPYK